MTPEEGKIKIWAILILLVVVTGIFFIKTKYEDVRCSLGNELCENLTTLEKNNFSFTYPKETGTEFISFFDWPPIIVTLEETYSCENAGSIDESSGKTEERRINGKNYCITEIVGAALGSMYTQYAYLTEKSGKLFSIVFSLRKPNCGNYDETKKAECEKRQNEYNIDKVVDFIVTSIEFK